MGRTNIAAEIATRIGIWHLALNVLRREDCDLRRQKVEFKVDVGRRELLRDLMPLSNTCREGDCAHYSQARCLIVTTAMGGFASLSKKVSMCRTEMYRSVFYSEAESLIVVGAYRVAERVFGSW